MDLLEMVKSDCKLPEHIFYEGQVSKASDCKKILLTGLTGLLGPYMLKSLLLKMNTQVYCIVRGNSLEKTKTKLDAFETKERIILLEGDLSKKHLGLELNIYEELLASIDAVIHCAVKSNHVHSYDFKRHEDDQDTIRNVNVFGTLRLIEFAATGKPKRILYASSFSAANRLSEDGHLSEALIEDDNFGDGMDNGYSLTKFVGEKLMTQAFGRGIEGLVIRFPMIVGDKETGLFNVQGNHMFYLLTSYLQTGQKPVYMSAFPAVPVDTCAEIATDLFFNDDVPSGIFNLMNPHGAEEDDFTIVAKRMGIEVKKVEFSTFIETSMKLGEKSILYPLRRFYFHENAEEKIKSFGLFIRIAFEENGARIANKCSKKFKMFVPNIKEIVDTPNELIYKMLVSNNALSYFHSD